MKMCRDRIGRTNIVGRTVLLVVQWYFLLDGVHGYLVVVQPLRPMRIPPSSSCTKPRQHQFDVYAAACRMATINKDSNSNGWINELSKDHLVCTASEQQMLEDMLRSVNVDPPWHRNRNIQRQRHRNHNQPQLYVENPRACFYVLATLANAAATATVTSTNAVVSNKNTNHPLAAGIQAEQLLRYMHQQAKMHPVMTPNTLALNYVLSAYAKCAAATTTTTTTTAVSASGGSSPSSTTTTTRMLSNQQRQNTAMKAYDLLHEWRQEWYQRDHTVKQDADLVSYNTVIAAFAKAGMPELAQKVFDEMQQRPSNHTTTTAYNCYQPDIFSYNALLNAYANAGCTDTVGGLFRWMRTEGPTPTIHSYNDVLYAYSKSSQPEQAEQFLNWWILEEQRLLQQNIKDKKLTNTISPTTQSYNIVLHALAQTSNPTNNNSNNNNNNNNNNNKNNNDRTMRLAKRIFSQQPRDTVSYHTMAMLYCQLSNTASESFAGVESVLDEVWSDTSVLTTTPWTTILSNILYSIATISDEAMPSFAERMVQEAVNRNDCNTNDLNLQVYNALLYCWSRMNHSMETTKNATAARRALTILTQLEEHCQPIQPDVSTYTNALICLRGAGDPFVASAEAIVTRLEELGPFPTVQVYTVLISIYARSNYPDKAVQALHVLRRMTDKDTPRKVQPTIVSYNSVLNACEYTSSNDSSINAEALRVACLVFDEALRGGIVQLNHLTYAIFLAALARLLPMGPRRREIVQLVFAKCQSMGLVSSLVLRKLRKAVESEQEYRNLLQTKHLSGHDTKVELPPEWTRRVLERRARDEV